LTGRHAHYFDVANGIGTFFVSLFVWKGAKYRLSISLIRSIKNDLQTGGLDNLGEVYAAISKEQTAQTRQPMIVATS
jgi:hypothetical protein